MRGKLDFETSLRARVALLKGLPVSVFDTVFKSIHLSKNAQEFISILQKKGILVGLVSGGFTPIVERLAKPWYFLFLRQPVGSQRRFFNRKISW